MPRGDRTGPAGAGPMTGRAAGHCTGNASPGYLNPVPGRGFGLGLGRGGFGGRGWRHGYFATGLPGWMRYGGQAPLPGKPDAEREKDLLRQQAEALRSEIDMIHKRLGELEAAEAAE